MKTQVMILGLMVIASLCFIQIDNAYAKCLDDTNCYAETRIKKTVIDPCSNGSKLIDGVCQGGKEKTIDEIIIIQIQAIWYKITEVFSFQEAFADTYSSDYTPTLKLSNRSFELGDPIVFHGQLRNVSNFTDPINVNIFHINEGKKELVFSQQYATKDNGKYNEVMRIPNEWALGQYLFVVSIPFQEYDTSFQILSSVPESNRIPINPKVHGIEEKFESPLKQFKQGIPVHEIKCKDGFQLVHHRESLKPVCVTDESFKKITYEPFLYSQLGGITNNEPILQEQMCETYPYSEYVQRDCKSFIVKDYTFHTDGTVLDYNIKNPKNTLIFELPEKATGIWKVTVNGKILDDPKKVIIDGHSLIITHHEPIDTMMVYVSHQINYVETGKYLHFNTFQNWTNQETLDFCHSKNMYLKEEGLCIEITVPSSEIKQLDRVYQDCKKKIIFELEAGFYDRNYVMLDYGLQYNNGTHTIDNNTCKLTPNEQIKECEKNRPDTTYRNDTHFHYRMTCEWLPNSYFDRVYSND